MIRGWVFTAIFCASFSAAAILGGARVEFNDPIVGSVIRFVNDSNSTQCSGVLISPRHVLTAAHCKPYLKKSLLAMTDPYSVFSKKYPTKDFISHPAFKKGQLSTPDIGIVVLEESIYNPKPISLFQGDDEALSGKVNLVLMGFGLSIDKSEKPEPYILRSVSKNSFTVSNHLLVINQSDKKGFCHSDSGGPAFITQDSIVKIIGIIRATEHRSGVQGYKQCLGRAYLTRVQPYLQWIKDTISEN